MSEFTSVPVHNGLILHYKKLQMIKKDSSGNEYMEIVMYNDESVRISCIKQGWTGSKCYRINLVDVNNHVRPGAEFPAENIQGVIDALNQLKNKN